MGRYTYPPRCTHPSPYGERGKLPFRFPVIDDEDRRERIDRIPGIRCTDRGTFACYDAGWIAAQATKVDLDSLSDTMRKVAQGQPLPVSPELWAGRGSPEFARLSDAVKSRSYQRPMVKFMGSRDWAYNADDMRMGKTITTITALTARGAKRLLFVVPGFARMVWVHEVMKWLGKVPFVLSGRGGDKGWFYTERKNGFGRRWVKGRDEVHEALRTTDVTIVNYDILQAQVERDFAGGVHYREDLMGQSSMLIQHSWDGGAIDEAHLLKGWKKGSSQWNRADLVAMFTKPAQCPILYLLSGTPMTNQIADYHNQLRVSAGGAVFGDKPWDFQVRYCDAGKKLKSFKKGRETMSVEYWDATGKSNVQELKRRLSCMLWGRKRREVFSEMPLITRQLMTVDIGDDKKSTATPRKKKEDVASKVAAYAKQNIKTVGPRGVQEALRSCELGHQVVLFTRYHNSREYIDRLVRQAISKRTYKLASDFRYFQIHGGISSDTRVGLCRSVSSHEGPCLVLANMDAMPGGVSLRGVTENHYLEPHDKLHAVFQSEARAAEEGAEPITSIFYAVPGSYSMQCYERLLPKLQTMDEVTNDQDARDLMNQLQQDYEKDIDDILAGFLTAVAPGMQDIDGEGVDISSE